MNQSFARSALFLGIATTVGCEQPKSPAPPVNRFASLDLDEPAPPRPAPSPVQPEPPPPIPADLPPLNPPPGPPQMAPPKIHWHERSVSEGMKNRQRGLRFRVIYSQSPADVTTRVSVKDRYGRETPIAARQEAGLHGYAGIDDVVAGMTRGAEPFAVKVEYLDPADNSWNDAVSYEFLPRQ